MLRSSFLSTVCLVPLALLTVPTAAFASDEASAESAADATNANANANDSLGLTDIIVTATKRATNVQETPIAISVMDSAELKKRHVNSLIDLADGGIPSLRVATYESRQSALTIGIRGIVPGDANQPAREQGVGVYIDGVYLGRQHGLNATLFDVDRIEVLRGPQGTLFGRNTEGGALSIVTKAPTGEFGGRAIAGIGNYGAYNAALHLDLPAVANFAIKVDAMLDHQNATTKNILEGEMGWNYHHRYGGRIAGRWTPTDRFTADIAFDIGRDETTPFYSQLINFNPNNYPVATLAELAAVNNNPNAINKIAPLAPAVVVTDKRMKVADIGVPQQVSVDKAKGLHLNLNWQATDDLEVRSITAWRTVDAAQWDNSGGAHRTPQFFPNTAFSRYSLSDLEQNQFSQELQAVGNLGAVDYVFGLYYFNENVGEIASTPSTNTWNATGTAYTINDSAPWQRANWNIARATRANSKSYAAFAQLTWHIQDSLRLTAGARYSHDEKDGVLYKLNNVASNFSFDISDNRIDPLITLAWDPNSDMHVYAKYATGYRAGGASSRSLTFRSFGPETVTSWEAGFKSELFDRRVRFNLAGYIMNRKNTQFDFDFYVPSGGVFRHNLETINAGTTKIRGIEADVTAQPIENLTLALSYAYTHIDAPAAPNPLLPGNPVQQLYVVYTPPHALSGAIDYDVPLSDSSDMALRFHVDANYSDRQYSFDNEGVLTDSSFIVNARVALADIPMNSHGQTLTLAAWARNLFNESHIYRRSNANSAPLDGVDYRTVLGDYANFNAPRTLGIDATISF